MPKAPQPMTAPQEKFTRMSAQGCTRSEIMLELFGIDLAAGDTPEKVIHAKDQQMTRWRRHPAFEAVWKDEIRQLLMNSAGKAYRVLNRQLDDNQQPWLANKAANDLLNHGRPQIYGSEENTVNVHIEGLPDIGSPDSEDV